MELSDSVFEVLSQYTNRKWKINGVLTYPILNDVQDLMERMVEELKSSSYDSIESGGILVKRYNGKIDIYVHLGELDETNNSI